MKLSSTIRDYEYLGKLKQAHAEYQAVVPEAKLLRARAFFAVCLEYWPLISRFPFRGARHIKENRWQRLRKISRMESANDCQANWQSCLWEDLEGFLKRYSPAVDERSYLQNFCALLGRALDRAQYNMLKYDLGCRRNVTQVSLSEPLAQGEDSFAWEDSLADGNGARFDTSAFEVILHAARTWVENRTRRSPFRGRIYRATAYAWWRNLQGELSVRELVETYGKRLCGPDQLYCLFRELTEDVRAALRRNGFFDIPEALRLPEAWVDHHLPDDDLDRIAA